MDELLRLLDDARADERAASRGRERQLRQAAEEAATFAGSLLDLAERGTPVSVRLTTGRSHHGPVQLVATDFAVIGAAWIRFEAISSIRPHAGERHGAATGHRRAVDLYLIEALARVQSERPRVLLVTAGESVAGELRAVGTDVVTLRLDGEPGSLSYSPSSAVLALFRSG